MFVNFRNPVPASDASSNEEVEFLKATVGELSRQVAALQTDLSTVKLQEFEAHEAHALRAQVRNNLKWVKDKKIKMKSFVPKNINISSHMLNVL